LRRQEIGARSAGPILHCKERGFVWFSLGLGPLAGLEHTPLPSLQSPWRRIAGLPWHGGKGFYNFLRLHAAKEQFDPVWQPRFQAAPGTIGPCIARADVAALANPLCGSIGR